MSLSFFSLNTHSVSFHVPCAISCSLLFGSTTYGLQNIRIRQCIWDLLKSKHQWEEREAAFLCSCLLFTTLAFLLFPGSSLPVCLAARECVSRSFPALSLYSLLFLSLNWLALVPCVLTSLRVFRRPLPRERRPSLQLSTSHTKARFISGCGGRWLLVASQLCVDSVWTICGSRFCPFRFGGLCRRFTRFHPSDASLQHNAASATTLAVTGEKSIPSPLPFRTASDTPLAIPKRARCAEYRLSAFEILYFTSQRGNGEACVWTSIVLCASFPASYSSPVNCKSLNHFSWLNDLGCGCAP